jgi:hypothetical protein
MQWRFLCTVEGKIPLNPPLEKGDFLMRPFTSVDNQNLLIISALCYLSSVCRGEDGSSAFYPPLFPPSNLSILFSDLRIPTSDFNVLCHLSSACRGEDGSSAFYPPLFPPSNLPIPFSDLRIPTSDFKVLCHLFSFVRKIDQSLILPS